LKIFQKTLLQLRSDLRHKLLIAGNLGDILAFVEPHLIKTKAPQLREQFKIDPLGTVDEFLDIVCASEERNCGIAL